MVGTLVTVRGDAWRVVDIAGHDDCQAWSLEGVRPSNRGERRVLIVPFDRPRRLESSASAGRRVGRRRAMLLLRALLAASGGARQLRAAASASIDLLGYQLEPVLACLAGETRLLVADEVGMGKTIEAGLIIAELAARGAAARTLVLAPASLCEQWSAELTRRFRLEPLVVDREALQGLACWSSLADGPWARIPLAIASLDFVKQPQVLRGMGAVRWDLLVVDEAHSCAAARHRAAAVDWLARRSRRVVLLTATPHAGNEESFRALCGIGRFPGEPPIAMFRRTRSALGTRNTRRVRLLRVAPSAAESSMHAALFAYAARVWQGRRGEASRADDPARLAMVVLCKRAASGATALWSSLSRRLQLIEGTGPPTATQLPLPLDEGLERDDEAPEGLLAAPGLQDEEEERLLLARLIALSSEAAGGESKPRVLLRLLSRTREPAIVFTEYRDTLEHIAARLAPLGPTVRLHGGMDQGERRQAVSRFNAGGARVLLATDAAAHGLNLHHACRLVVNLELPWSPLRLEQRIGRVDRIGQGRPVHAIHLAARGTIEDEVLGRLAMKIESVRRAVGIGASPLGRMGEAELAAGIFERPGPDPHAPFPGSAVAPAETVRPDLGADAAAEARRLALVRVLGGPRSAGGADPSDAMAGPPGTPWRAAIPARRTALAPGIYALFRLRILDGRGALLEEGLVPLQLPKPPGGLGAGRHSLQRWDAVVPVLAEAARAEAERRLLHLRDELRPAVSRHVLRESLIAAVDAEEPQPVQPGLFDRRALKAAEEAAARRRLLAEEGAARRRELHLACRPALASPPELLLLLVVSPGARRTS